MYEPNNHRVGNVAPDGGSVTAPITAVLGDYLKRLTDGGERTWNERLVETVVGQAVGGDVKTIQMILNRVEGSKSAGIVAPPVLEIDDELARKADLALVYGPLDEVCPLGLAPSTSTTVMIALGDALAFVLSRLRDFSFEDFARFHPAGSLGRKLVKVEAVMRHDDELRLAEESETVREVFARARRRGRRTGAVMLADAAGRLAGFFTDSDLARLFEKRREGDLDKPIGQIMTIDPKRVRVGAMLSDAVELMQTHKISELPVVDRGNHLVGLIDVTDLIGLVSPEGEE